MTITTPQQAREHLLKSTAKSGAYVTIKTDVLKLALTPVDTSAVVIEETGPDTAVGEAETPTPTRRKRKQAS